MCIFRRKQSSGINVFRLPVIVKMDALKGYIQVKVSLKTGESFSLALDEKEVREIISINQQLSTQSFDTESLH